MVEMPGQELLATWQVHVPPEEWGAMVPAVRLPDHRRVYLEYEGEISGDRGHVTRVDEGTVEISAVGDRWHLVLHGTRIREKIEVEVSI
jgi:hypothetical protein